MADIQVSPPLANANANNIVPAGAAFIPANQSPTVMDVVRETNRLMAIIRARFTGRVDGTCEVTDDEFYEAISHHHRVISKDNQANGPWAQLQQLVANVTAVTANVTTLTAALTTKVNDLNARVDDLNARFNTLTVNGNAVNADVTALRNDVQNRFMRIDARHLADYARAFNKSIEDTVDVNLRKVVKYTHGHPNVIPTGNGCFDFHPGDHFDIGAEPPDDLVPPTLFEIRHLCTREMLESIFWFYNDLRLDTRQNGMNRTIAVCIDRLESFLTKPY